MPSIKLSPPIYELRERLDYNPETGVISWSFKNDLYTQRRKPYLDGRIAFNSNNEVGYKVGSFNGKRLYAHRVAWALYYGEWPENQIDHINMDKSDNRISNLRHATGNENQWNRTSLSTNTSGFKGVNWCNTFSRWIASIKCDGKRYYLGHHRTKEAAFLAYKSAADNLHGDFKKYD